MGQRWPLHPKPRSYETLEQYVRRLAECYGVRYERFCLLALGISVRDDGTRILKEPTPKLLRQISDHTGISVDRLACMTYKRVWAQVMDELNRFASTPEGKAWMEQMENRMSSQKSNDRRRKASTDQGPR